jgi:hypothetical protein
VHLVGFTIGIYYDARTYGRQKWEVNLYIRVSDMILMYVHACACCNVSARYVICVGVSLTVSSQSGFCG